MGTGITTETTSTDSSLQHGNQLSETRMRLQVCPTIGGPFDLFITRSESVDGLRRQVARRLKVSKEKINLLYKQRVLKQGTLEQNLVTDGSKITLLPSVESGLMSQKSEHNVLQALENLSDAQVNDFLSGKSPLTLMLRLGDHVMFMELQLSTTPQNVRRTTTTAVSSSVPGPCPTAQHLPRASTKHHGNATAKTTTATTTPSHCPSTPHLPIIDSAAIAQISNGAKQAGSHTCCCVPRSGAIIESMHHHGQGVFSGTFSGTLNPTLQDTEGRPRKNINTIVHILNDLLGVTPHYRAQLNCRHTPQQSQPPSPSAASTPRDSFNFGDINQLSQENQATRGKMEQLQLMLEERRRRRHARRDARAPYWTVHRNAAEYLHQQRSVDNIDISSRNENLNDGYTEFPGVAV